MLGSPPLTVNWCSDLHQIDQEDIQVTLYSMSDKELTRLDTIRKLVEKRLTRAQASELLGLSIRQVQRLKTAYQAHGISGLTSKKRGKPSNRRYPDSFKDYVIHLVRENYCDFGPQLANEKLRERHELHVGVSTLRSWMIVSRVSGRRVRKPASEFINRETVAIALVS